MKTTASTSYTDDQRFDFADARRASWGAIFVGGFIALAVQILFTLLGISVGLAAVDPGNEDGLFDGLGTGVGLFSGVGALVALFLGGGVAARLAGIPRRIDGMLHAVAVWAIVSVLTIYLATTATGSLVSTTAGALGRVFQTAGSGIAAAMPENPFGNVQVDPDTVRANARDYLQRAGVSEQAIDQFLNRSENTLDQAARQGALNPPQAYEQITTAFANIAQRAQNLAQREIDREDAADLIARNTGMTQQNAGQVVDRWIEYAQQQNWGESIRQLPAQAAQTVTRATDRVAGAVSSAAAWTFVAFLLGLGAAAGGGWLGCPTANGRSTADGSARSSS